MGAHKANSKKNTGKSRILTGDTAAEREDKPREMHIFGGQRQQQERSEEEISRYRKPGRQETDRTPAGEERQTQRQSASRPVTGKHRAPDIAIPHSDEVDEGPLAVTAPLSRVKQQPKPSWTDEDEPAGPVGSPQPVRRGDVRIPIVQGRPSEVPLDLKQPTEDAETFGEERERHRLASPRAEDYVFPDEDLLREPQARTDISPEEDADRSRRL